MSIASTFVRHASLVRTSILACTLAIALTGCLFDGDLVPDRSGNETTGSTSVGGTSNQAPTISGSPITSARVNEAYSFQPIASDPEGDALTFQISNKPAWATFDTGTGRLSGTPSTPSTGALSDVRITLSDGRASSAPTPAIGDGASRTSGWPISGSVVLGASPTSSGG